MGCSSSTQTEDVVPPSSHYLSNDTKPVIETLPEAKSIQQIDHPALVPAPEPETKNEVETKKEEDRVMTAATEELRHQAMKHVPEGKAFIFGQSENERKILLLDCEKMQFSILSNRTQSPNTPHKYQPQQVIFQQSQELLASNLFNTNSHPPYNFMFITFTCDQTIFLCGGVNYHFDYVSEEAFLFRVSSIVNEEPQPRRKKGGNNLVGNKFEKLSCMKQKRYSHMGAYFNMGKLGYIYVFGGRDQDEGLLNTCEQYSIEQSTFINNQTEKWREISPMKTPRSTGFSLIFKNKIYVFGGYTGDKKRSKTIEVFDPFKNYWQILNVTVQILQVKLHRGIEAGLMFSVKANEVLLMGGNMESGSLKSVIRLNLADQTYVWESNMKNERLLQKGVKLQETIYVFGGDFQDNFEKYSLKDKKWKDHQFSFNEFVSIDDINSYQMASETLEVPFDQTLLSKTDNANDYQKHLIFGNDNFPCILELNLNKWVLKKKVVPMALRLRCHMGVAKVVEGKYFICGGIDSFGEKPSRASYIYYTGTNKAIQVGKMRSKKYNFSIWANSKYAYIFGGKNQSGEIIKECQKYSFEQEKWIPLPDLPSERQGAKAIMVSNKILLFGGSDTLQTVTSIDIFDMESQTFWNSKQSLPIPAQVRGIHLQETPSLGVYIFSYNQVLTKYYCHHMPLHIPDHNEQLVEAQKIQDNFSIIKQVQEIQLNVKIIPFIHAFSVQNKVNLITPKGLFNWQPKVDPKTQHKFENQIVINQVEMMQYPIDKFSTA